MESRVSKLNNAYKKATELKRFCETQLCGKRDLRKWLEKQKKSVVRLAPPTNLRVGEAGI
jgi:hypothetical protein